MCPDLLALHDFISYHPFVVPIGSKVVHVCSSGVKTFDPHILILLRYVHCYPLVFHVCHVQQLLPEMLLLKVLRCTVVLISVCHLIDQISFMKLTTYRF